MSNVEDIEKIAALWVAREDGGLVDRTALNAWLAQATAHQVAYLRLKNAWQRADSLAALRASLPAPKRWPSLEGMPTRMLAAAAVLVCACGIASVFYWPVSDTYITATGQQKTIQLADGSRIEMNTNTRIQTGMDGNARAVTLDSGQAYFEVVHDSRHPFVVLAGNRRITDLGTKFSVQRNGDDVEIIVKEGKVRVDVLNAALTTHPGVIADGGKVVVARDDETLVAAKAPQEIAAALEWRYGMLVFNQETLADVATQFNRYNRRKIVVEGTARDVRIGGSFRVDNINVFAQLVQQGFGLTVNSDDSKIVISKEN